MSSIIHSWLDSDNSTLFAALLAIISIFLYPFLNCGAQIHTVLEVRPHKARTNTFQQLAVLFLVHLRIQLPLFAVWVYYWLSLYLPLTKTPRLLSTGDSSVSCLPAYIYMENYSVPRATSGICGFETRSFCQNLHGLADWCRQIFPVAEAKITQERDVAAFK